MNARTGLIGELTRKIDELSRRLKASRDPSEMIAIIRERRTVETTMASLAAMD